MRQDVDEKNSVLISTCNRGLLKAGAFFLIRGHTEESGRVLGAGENALDGSGVFAPVSGVLIQICFRLFTLDIADGDKAGSGSFTQKGELRGMLVDLIALKQLGIIGNCPAVMAHIGHLIIFRRVCERLILRGVHLLGDSPDIKAFQILGGGGQSVENADLDVIPADLVDHAAVIDRAAELRRHVAFAPVRESCLIFNSPLDIVACDICIFRSTFLCTGSVTQFGIAIHKGQLHERLADDGFFLRAFQHPPGDILRTFRGFEETVAVRHSLFLSDLDPGIGDADHSFFFLFSFFGFFDGLFLSGLRFGLCRGRCSDGTACEQGRRHTQDTDHADQFFLHVFLLCLIFIFGQSTVHTGTGRFCLYSVKMYYNRFAKS